MDYNDLSKAYTEVLTILSYMEPKYVDMIPKKLLNLFKENKCKNYNPNITTTLPLSEQNLQRKTLALLAMLYLNYWCENENEKTEMLKIYSENGKKIDEEMRVKYNPDNLFKQKDENHSSEDVQLIEYKGQNIFKKILSIIMKFFKK